MLTELVVLAVTCVSAAAEQPAPREYRIGQVFIVGNEITQDRVIRDAIELFPGQVLKDGVIGQAERRLARLGLFAVNPEHGIRPAVSVLEGPADSDFKDILVQVKETPTGCIKLRPGIDAQGRIVLGLTIEERNFDPWRLPTCMDDLRERRAFRGGGQKLRIALIEIPLCSVPSPVLALADRIWSQVRK